MILLILKISFLYIFSGDQTIIFYSKSVILIVLCLVLTNSLLSTILLRGLRLNYSVNIETIFHILLVVIYATLNVKNLNRCMYFSVPQISCPRLT